MDLTGQRRIAASCETVFAALNDPEILRRAIPGCESLKKAADESFAATVLLRVGPVKARFNGAVTLTNLNPPASYTLIGEGKGGAAGFAKGTADVELQEVVDGTLLSYRVHADRGGKIAQLGSRLVTGTADELSGEFFDGFAAQVEAEGSTAQGGAAPADAPAEPAAAAEPVPAAPAVAASQAAAARSQTWIWWAVGGVAALTAVAFALG